MEMQDTKTYKNLSNFEKVWLYESLNPEFEDKIFYFILWINPLGFGIMLADRIRFYKIMHKIIKELKEEK